MVNATVSLPHLITYAKNHGSECEFAGNTFGMQMKLYQMQQQNELKALENLYESLKVMIPQAMHWEIKVGEPKVEKENSYKIWCWDCTDRIITQQANEGILKDEQMEQSKKKILDKFRERMETINPDDYYIVPITVSASVFDGTYNDQGTLNEPLLLYILKTLKSISMTEEERDAAKARNIHNFRATYGYNTCDHRHLYDICGTEWKPEFYFRNEEAKKIIDKIKTLIAVHALNFAIEDNFGKKHRLYFYIGAVEYAKETDSLNNILFDIFRQKIEFPNIYGSSEWILDNDDEIFSMPLTDQEGDGCAVYNKYSSYDIPLIYSHGCRRTADTDSEVVARFYMRIPKKDIGKYTSFKVVRDIEI